MHGPLGTINRNGGPVGIKLWVEVMDHSPAALTWRERWVLAVLAEDANDESRQCFPSFDGDDDRSARFRARTRCSRSQYYATMSALANKGVVKSLRRGQKYGSAKYLILPMGPVQRPGLRDTEPDSQRPGLQDTDRVQGPDSQDTERPSQGPGFDDSGSRFRGLSVPVSSSQGPGLQDLYSSVPSIPSSLSSEVEFVRAANVVLEAEERDFADWIIKTRKPGSPGWWRTVVGNGDIVVLAAAWRATRAPKQPARDELAECRECRDPIKGPVRDDGLCTDCRTFQVAEASLATVPGKDRGDALGRARAEGLNDPRAQTLRAAQLLYEVYGQPEPDWPPPEDST